VTWETRTICTFVAATVPVEKAGDMNPLLELAQAIGEPPQPDEPDAKPKTTEPTAGSYERFMSTFGNPRRWAGRS
jgi:hypothetical protein